MSIDVNPTAIGLVLSGAIAPLLYVATVILGAAARARYSHVANAVSELVETGAPHRAPLNVAFFAYNVLSMGFGLGITVLAADPTIVLSGWLIVGTGILGVAMTWFPMDPIGSAATRAGRGHLVLAGLMSVGTMASVLSFAMGSAAIDGWSSFSAYSYLTFGVVLITGSAAALSARGHWRTMGLWERITIGAFLQWQAVLAIVLLTTGS